MTGIVLSASVRQNLLSLQSTASLLATTQNDLATGNKVNSALDNPTSYFTAAALNNRASDISNLLDGIGNGVQVLQAANTGITSLQSLVASAQSVANQVLQTPVGYSAKSSVSTTAIARRHRQQPARHRRRLHRCDVRRYARPPQQLTAFTSATATGSVALQRQRLGSCDRQHLAGRHRQQHLRTVLTASRARRSTSTAQTLVFSASATATSSSGSTTTIGLGSGSTSTLGDITAFLTTVADRTSPPSAPAASRCRAASRAT